MPTAPVGLLRAARLGPSRPPSRCGCGSLLPAIRVVGRRDDVLRFAADGSVIEVLPLAITAELEAVSGLERIQLVQSGPS